MFLYYGRVLIVLYDKIQIITNKKLNFLLKFASFFEKKKLRFIVESKKKISMKFIFVLIICLIIGECLWCFLPRNYLDIRLVDVGQGDCIFIETNDRKKILIDGGGSETYDVGENILLPYLLDSRVMCVDTIISSHSDADHLNGLITVLENIKVNRIIMAKNAFGYERVYEIAKEKGIDIIEVIKGDIIKIGDITLEVISPNINTENTDVNDYSLVVKLVYGEKSMLLTGDISQSIEKNLYNVNADILKVAHHGSSSSSDESFIKRVNPKVSIIGVGQDNKYGHPSEKVIKRLERTSKVYTTAEYGEIKIKMYMHMIKIIK